MLRANFFNKLFKYRKNSNYKIIKYNSNTEFDLQDITVYSGSIKPNSTWVKFVKESVC